MMNTSRFGRARGSKVALATIASVAIATSCTENLPVGPTTFSSVQLQVLTPHDTLVVGDSGAVGAQALDGSSRVIQALRFGWTSADTTIVGLVAATDSDGVAGRKRVLVGRRPGRTTVTLALPDLRFVTQSSVRNETVVVGGVKVLNSHDTTLTAINDTGVVIATSLVKSNGALVNRASQGVKWTHLGQHTTLVGTGDTVRYIAKSNGADTLIAGHDFCLATAKCADTVVARVGQLLTLTISGNTFSAWSFGDSLGPSVTLKDRRGSGLAGTSVKLVPITAADSAIVKISAAPVGTSDPNTGALAAPRMISAKNGTAHVRVLALLPDGFSVVALDSVTETVRQVARRVAVEPLSAVMSFIDSVPLNPVARDARGAPIADATVAFTASNVTLNGTWAGPTAPSAAPVNATIVATVTGKTLPDSNPAAPQVPVVVDTAALTLVKVDTLVAGATSVNYVVTAVDSLRRPAQGQWVRFGTKFGALPDSVQLDATGSANVTWVPKDSAGKYTLTGVRGTTAIMATPADSAGRVVLQRSVFVKPAAPSQLKTTVAISATTITHATTATVTVTVKDAFGNKITNATNAMFTSSTTGGTLGAFTCVAEVCTATYTAPGAAGAASISVQIGGLEVLFSPLTLTIN